MVRALALAVVAAALTAPAAAAYPWPVKPFNVQHAVRGGFDDPRSLRGSVDPVVDNPLSFHDGIDIQARDGSAVFAVAPGIVSHPNRSAVAVTSGGITFGYWHVYPAVGVGSYIGRGQLVGFVRPGAGHVHLAERRFGRYVNPLRRGGIAPYSDTTPPNVRGLIFYRCGTRTELPSTALSGCVDLAVDAYDPPSLQPKAPWADVVLAPSRISWGGLFGPEAWRPVGFAPRIVDFAQFEVSGVRNVYAPGTRQNQRNWQGDYRFRLARNVDTNLLGDGEHSITVTATDVRGNSTTRALTFTVANAPAVDGG